MAFARVLQFILVLVTFGCAISAESSPHPSGNVVYSRYVRFRPTRYSKHKFFKEVIEVFHTKRRPPPYAFLSDEDLTRFVRCDYDPSLSGCEDVGIGPSPTSSSSRKPSTTTTPNIRTLSTTSDMSALAAAPARSTTTRPSSSPESLTTTTLPSWYRPSTTTTQLSSSATITESTTTKELPFLPDVKNDEEDESEESENGEEYEEETEEAEDDNGNSGQDENYLTDDNEADYTTTPEEPPAKNVIISEPLT